MRRSLCKIAQTQCCPRCELQPIADLPSTDQVTVRKVLSSEGPGKFDAESRVPCEVVWQITFRLLLEGEGE
jgi:hypothetical protein